MFFGKKKSQERAEDKKRYLHAADKLYKAAMEQARDPLFYEEQQVPDSVDGRFELLTLHMFLLWDRLEAEKDNVQAASDLSQALFDVMFKSLDSNLRMAGVGDLGVPKHVKRMMKAYKGRCMAYREALEKKDDAQALRTVLERNLFGTVTQAQSTCLDYYSVYIQSSRKLLSRQSFATLEQGDVKWVDTGLKKAV